jgi:hypothetical protein
MDSKDILRKVKEDRLDQVHSNEKVLETIRRGRLVLLSEAKSLKAN